MQLHHKMKIKAAHLMMVIGLLAPSVLMGASDVASIETPLSTVQVVHADHGNNNHDNNNHNNSHGGGHGGDKNNDKHSDNNKSGSSKGSTSGKSESTTQDEESAMAKAADSIAQKAAKELLEDNTENHSSSDNQLKHNYETSLKNFKAKNKTMNIGNAWSFMGAPNSEIFDSNNKAEMALDITKKPTSGKKIDNRYGISGYESYYKTMVYAARLPYVLNSLGLDRSWVSGFDDNQGQKLNAFQSSAASLMSISYGATTFVNALFTHFTGFLNEVNPFMWMVKGVSATGKFTPIANLMRSFVDASKSIGMMFAAFVFMVGVGLAIMGFQVGQQASVSPGRGIAGAALDLFKRGFIIIALPTMLYTSFSFVLSGVSELFKQPDLSVGNYAVYSTMVPFDKLVSYHRLALPSEVSKSVKDYNTSKVQSLYLTHQQVLQLNGSLGYTSTKDMLNDQNNSVTIQSRTYGDPDAANHLIQNYKDQRTITAGDYASAIISQIPNYSKKQKEAVQKSGDDRSKLTNLAYSDNGNMTLSGDTFTTPNRYANGDDTLDPDDQGGLSTIGMYNYLRSFAHGTTVRATDTQNSQSQLSNPQHAVVNVVGTGTQVTGNLVFALGLMWSLTIIAVMFIYFAFKCVIDSIPDSLAGGIQGSFGSLAGGARMLGAFFTVLVTLVGTGFMYQLSIKALICFTQMFDNIFESVGTGQGTGAFGTIGTLIFGPAKTTAAGYAGAVAVGQTTYGAASLLFGIIMILIAFMFIRWRNQLVRTMTASLELIFSRITASAGAITGKGSTAFQNNQMTNQANKSANSGLGQMAGLAKSGMTKAGNMMRSMSGGRGSAGKIGRGLMAAGMGAGLGAGLAEMNKDGLLKGITGNGKDGSKGADGKGANGKADNPKNAEEARSQALNNMMQSRMGDPLTDMASRNKNDGADFNADIGNGIPSENTGNPMTDLKNAAGNNRAMAQNGTGDPLQQMALNGDSGKMQQLAMQGNPMGASAKTGAPQQLAKLNGGKHNAVNKHNGQAGQSSLDTILAQAEGLQANNAALQDNLGTNGYSNDVTGLNSVLNDGLQTADPDVLSDANGGVATDMTDPTQNLGPMDSLNNAQNLGAVDPNALQADGTTVDGQQVQTPGQQVGQQILNHNADKLANGLNNLAGSKVVDAGSVKAVGNTLGTLAQGAADTIQAVDSPTVGMNGATGLVGNAATAGTTITADGAGGATVTAGGPSVVASPVGSINSNTAFGLGQGVMPGNAPIGMNMDPSYTQSGAGVLHGGLNNALGGVQNTQVRLHQAQTAMNANPNNQILQQRFNDAAQAHQTAQVQAIQAFNQEPAANYVGDLVNSGSIGSTTVGQVNSAISDVYDKQMAFKNAIATNGQQSIQAQNAARAYQSAIQNAHAMHVKSSIINNSNYLHQAYQSIRKQQQSIIDGSFKI